MSAGDSTPATPPPTLEWRPARPEDEPFLDELYEGTRIDEVLGWGFDPASARAFLRQQAHIQRRAYAMQYPDAEHRVLLADGVPAGRLILARLDDVLVIVDVSVLAAFRARGIGTWAIREVQQAAADEGKPALLHVESGNRALRLYERLGFRETGADASDMAPLTLEWRAS